MNVDLDQWIAKEVDRQSRRSTLEEALFCGKSLKYFWYRLRYFIAVQGLFLASHLIEFLLLYHFVAEKHLNLVVVVYTVCALTQAFWWGSLESLRNQIRILHFHKQLYRVPATLKPWLLSGNSLALLSLTAAFIAAASAYIFVVIEIYTLTVALIFAIRLAIFFIVSTIHAAIYAVQRVYVPIPTLLRVDLIGILSLPALWAVADKWCFPIVFFATTLTKASIRFRSIQKSYESHRWQITWRWPLSRVYATIKSFGSILTREFFKQGASGVFLGLDLLVLLAVLLSTHAISTQSKNVLLMVFLVSPLMRAAHSWVYLFYFDLQKLNFNVYSHLKWIMQRYLFVSSIVAGAFLGGIAQLCAVTVLGEGVLQDSFLLYPVFILISLLATKQIEAFCDNSHASLAVAGATLIFMCLITVGSEDLLSRVALCLFTSYLSLILMSLYLNQRHPSSYVCTLPQWLELYREWPAKSGLMYIELEEESPSIIREDILLMINNILGRQGHAACFGHEKIVVLGPLELLNRIRTNVPRISAGYVPMQSVCCIPTEWQDRLQEIYDRGIISDMLYQRLARPIRASSPKSQLIHEITHRFHDLFPHGQVIDLTRTTHDPARQDLVRSEPSLIPATLHFARYFEYFKGPSNYISALCADNGVELLFLIPKGHKRGKVLEMWRENLIEYSFLCSTKGSNIFPAPPSSL